jgi:hypothetical protein
MKSPDAVTAPQLQIVLVAGRPISSNGATPELYGLITMYEDVFATKNSDCGRTERH